MKKIFENLFNVILCIPAFILTIISAFGFIIFPILTIIGAKYNYIGLLYIGGILSIIYSFYFFFGRLFKKTFETLFVFILLIYALITYEDIILSKFESSMLIISIALIVFSIFDVIEDMIKSHFEKRKFSTFNH